MPRRRRRRRRARRKRRRPRRRKRRRRRFTSMVKKSFAVSMPYVDIISMSSGLTPSTYYYFSANALQTVDVTGGSGHQPLGYNDFTLRFVDYTVVGARIQATFTTTSNTLTPILCTISTENNALAPAFPATTEIEQGNVSWGMLTGRSAGQKLTLTKTWSAKKFAGVAHPVGESTLSARFGLDPTFRNYFRLRVLDMSAPTVLDLTVMVRITYAVVCTVPRDILPS